MDYNATIDGARITDWASFHAEFQREMGFFDGYGRSMNAWIDCMTDMYTNGEYKSLTKYDLNDGDRFTLRILHTREFQSKCPEIFEAFIKSSAFANSRSKFTQFYLELL